MKALVGAAVGACLTVLLFASCQLPSPRTVNAEVEKPQLTPGGRVSEFLGEYVTIEGVRSEEGRLGSDRCFIVDTVNEKKLAEPLGVSVRGVDLPRKKRCVLKGYETGQMIGTPPAMFEAGKELGRQVGSSQACWQFATDFVVLIVVEPKGVEQPKW